MGTIDDATWFALALSLTALGGLVTFLMWRRRGVASGLRALAFTLLPFAAYFTKTLRLLGRVAQEVSLWAASFVFNPLVWLGVGLVGISAVLFATSAFLRRRSPAGPAQKGATTQLSGRPAAQPAKQQGAPAIKDDDMDDIEAILKRRGIS